jgi:predicted ATPase/class 3 adenylate cyclase
MGQSDMGQIATDRAPVGRDDVGAPPVVPAPSWPAVLRALREAQGVSQEGWGAQLGYSQATVRRWERGVVAPTAAAEQALVAHCRERGLLRTYQRAPLAGVHVTADFLLDLLAEARLGPSAPRGNSSKVQPDPVVDRRPELPAGTVTLLFTDIEASTQLLQQLDDHYPAVLAAHQEIIRAAVLVHKGIEVDTQGDAFFVAFARAGQAVAAATAVQRTLAAWPWPAGRTVRVRMAIHTGTPTRTAEGYTGLDVHRGARICAAGHGGQVLLSEPTAKLVQSELPSEVSLRDLGEHRFKDLPYPERVFQAIIPELPAEFPPLRSLDSHPHNLPVQLTSFVGRGREMAEVQRLMGGARLLTLTGSGGVGKTRLALQIATKLLVHQRDGVWLVDLGPVADPALVPQAVAAVLRVREQAGRALVETVIDTLRAKRVLLVLDSCEHLVTACAELVGALLSRCPELAILVTSREVLGIAGEQTYRVPPLALPDGQHAVLLGQLLHYEAVQLFMDRARAVRPDFAVTEANARAMAQVCRRLDGIPLAIELAAARVKVLTVEQIARRLDDRFRLLAGGSRMALPRQQTLRAAKDWSYELLSETERAVLRWLAVFAGGWSVEAAEAVCTADGTDEGAILDLLMHLVDKSLVVVEEQDGEVRYRLLETIRQYARDKLVEAGDVVAVRDRHRAWYLALAEGAEPELWGTAQSQWLTRLEAEHDNLRAALEWSLETGAPETSLCLAGALWKFWEVRGYLSEGRRWLERALAASGAPSPAARAMACAGAGVLARHQGEYDRARALLDEGLALCRAHDDRRGIAAALNNLGVVARRQGDFDRASALLKESLAIRRELGDDHGIASSLNNLGVLARHQGQYGSAIALLEECLALRRELGDKQGIANTLNNLGHAVRKQADLIRALALLREGLILDQELQDKAGIAFGLEGLAAVACEQGQAVQAARWFGAAELLRDAIGAPLSPVDRTEYEHSIATTRGALGDEAFAMARAAGRALLLEQASAEALGPAPLNLEPEYADNVMR